MHKQSTITIGNRDKNNGIFILFCAWTYVLLCRPQDIFMFLGPMRPALLLGVLTIFSFIFFHSLDLKRINFKNKQIKLYILLCIVIIVSIPFSLYPRRSFDLTIILYSQVVANFLAFNYLVNQRNIERLLLCNCAGVGIYALSILFKGQVSINNRIEFGNMFDPNDMSFFVISFISFYFLFLAKKYHPFFRFSAMVCIIACICIIFMTGSRGGFVAFLTVVGTLLLTKRMVEKKGKMLVIFVLLVVGANISINHERYSTLLKLTEDYNVTGEEGRLSIWKRGMGIMFSNPLTGVGVGCFPEAIGRDRVARELSATRWQAAHNSLVQIGTETGILGFFLFGYISLQAMRIFWQANRQSTDEDLARIAEAAMVGFAGHLMATMFLSQAYSAYWAFYIALSAILLNWQRQKNIPVKLVSTRRKIC